MRVLENVTVRIVPRQTLDKGHPYTDLYHEWDEQKIHRWAFSRTWIPIDDTVYGRAAAIAAFIKRQQT